MSFVIQGPYPEMKTTLLLPSPEIGNNKGNASTVQTIRAVDGTLYTYIKSKRARQVFNWDFLTSRDKFLEAKEFVREYEGGLVKVTDHRGTSKVGYIIINPLEGAGAGRAGGWGDIEEAVSFAIEFEERV